MKYEVIVKENGDRLRYLNGKLHCEDEPAIEKANGNRLWYLNNKLHRKDGPAMEYANGKKWWYLNGEELSEEEFNKRTKPNLNNKIAEIDGIKYKLIIQQ